MNDKIRSLIAQKDPAAIKKTAEKARYGILSDPLTLGEMAELWGQDGLEKDSPKWDAALKLLIDLIKSELLECVDKDVALGKIDPDKKYVSDYKSRMDYHTSTSDIYYQPRNAKVYCEKFKNFLGKNDLWGLIDDFLIKRWLQVESDLPVEINPKHARSKTNLRRDELALILLKDNPELRDEIKKAVVKSALQTCDKRLFDSGFDDWWATQNIFKRIDRGGSPKKK